MATLDIKTRGRATNLDVYIGKKLKEQRLRLGLSQTKLADMLGLTFQQVQKYEKGEDRIAASRLPSLSDALDVPLVYFFPPKYQKGAQKWKNPQT